MSRGEAPTLHCDEDEEGCIEWELDDFGMYVSTHNGVPITATERAIGWLTIGDQDFCPEHAQAHRAHPE